MSQVSSVDVRSRIDAGREAKPREKWRRNLDFLFACIGFSIGFGNVWRFPFLCFKNGGGAFLIPYFISCFLVGIPMFFLEVSVGQLMSRGGPAAWEIIPLFKGVGYAGVFVLFCLNCYYNVILAWIIFYLFASVTSSLPWTTCDNWWNTENCHDFTNGFADTNSSLYMADPVSEYWEHRVLGLSAGIDTVGTVRWELALCLLVTWAVVFLCIFQGIHESSKVCSILSTLVFPVPFISKKAETQNTLLHRTLPYYSDAHSADSNCNVWSDAGTQIFFSYSISVGTLTALGSYNDFHHNSFRDTGIFAFLNTCVSFIAGCIIFTTLGYMSETSGIPIARVAEAGPGLAFVAYPKALSTMPLSPLWSVLFFLILLLLGLDSQAESRIE
ncbi:unnamed protein product [Dibothriocephalus latus]|uniref:Transporter n=1 Tax=Dibothriocephalus latus TaxID=60516 RepID=A0A3P6TI28_DIBLA|nr:unnamed protein product [Dibothriocephalus latus]